MAKSISFTKSDLNLKPETKSNYSVTDYQSKKKAIWKSKLSSDILADLKKDRLNWSNALSYYSEASPIVKAIFTNFPVLVLGKGFKINPKIEKEVAETVKKLWDRWTSSCHINGQDDLFSILCQIIGEIIRNGDCLVYLTSDANEEIKIDIISSNKIENPPDALIPKGCKVNLGVQVDSNKTISGYWVRQDSKETPYIYIPAFDEDGSFVSALIKSPISVGQIDSYRGISPLAASITTIERLEETHINELEATNFNRKIIGTYKTKPRNIDDVESDLTSNLQATEAGDIKLFVMPETDSLEFKGTNDVSNPQIPELTKLLLQLIVAPLNISEPMLFCRLDDSSYSTNQSMKTIAFENTEPWRLHLIRNILKPILSILIENWKAAKLIPENLDYTSIEFIGRNNITVRPKDYYDAQGQAINQGVKSLQQVCLENDTDAFSIISENAELEQAKKETEKAFQVDILEKVDLQKTAQVMAIVDKVLSKTLTPEGAITILQTLYLFNKEEAETLINSLKGNE